MELSIELVKSAILRIKYCFSINLLNIVIYKCLADLRRPTLHAPENRLILRALPWGATYVVTIQHHVTKV